MKRHGKPIFFIVALLVLALGISAIVGIHTQNGDLRVTHLKGVEDIRWGIDIRGGVEATFKPEEGLDATNEQMDSAKSIIEVRMVKNNITDYELYVDYDNDRIIVRFPWKVEETEFNPEEAIKELSATARLTFREGNPIDSTTGLLKEDSEDTVLLEGKDVESATAGVIQEETGSMKYVVNLKFNEDGTKKFAEATEEFKGETISIWMDDTLLSAPTVESVITEGTATISGNFTAAEATDLANKINAGALPFKLETDNYGSIDPTMGASALTAMGIAGIIALILIFIFMISFYRLPGLIACIALLGQVGLSIAAVSGYFNAFPSFTLTLPGIAGIILSIGMGVDANIITSERVKEELLAGKTLTGAIEKGCKSSFWAIFDGNITVIIVAVILMGVFGPTNILSALFGPSTTGVIYSFGYTLLIGVISNFIMGVGASRLMLRSVASFKCLRKKSLYGGAAE